MRCVCSHPRGLHKNGVCQARVNPCGCRQFETPEDAQKPSPFAGKTTYSGIYNRRYRA